MDVVVRRPVVGDAQTPELLFLSLKTFCCSYGIISQLIHLAGVNAGGENHEVLESVSFWCLYSVVECR